MRWKKTSSGKSMPSKNKPTPEKLHEKFPHAKDLVVFLDSPTSTLRSKSRDVIVSGLLVYYDTHRFASLDTFFEELGDFMNLLNLPSDKLSDDAKHRILQAYTEQLTELLSQYRNSASIILSLNISHEPREQLLHALTLPDDDISLMDLLDLPLAQFSSKQRTFVLNKMARQLQRRHHAWCRVGIFSYELRELSLEQRKIIAENFCLQSVSDCYLLFGTTLEKLPMDLRTILFDQAVENGLFADSDPASLLELTALPKGRLTKAMRKTLLTYVKQPLTQASAEQMEALWQLPADVLPEGMHGALWSRLKDSMRQTFSRNPRELLDWLSIPVEGFPLPQRRVLLAELTPILAEGIVKLKRQAGLLLLELFSLELELFPSALRMDFLHVLRPKLENIFHEGQLLKRLFALDEDHFSADERQWLIMALGATKIKALLPEPRHRAEVLGIRVVRGSPAKAYSPTFSFSTNGAGRLVTPTPQKELGMRTNKRY